MGLPEGLAGRLSSKRINPFLTVHFIDRIDQIHFKLYAAVDRGGYHVEDLIALEPDTEELETAARWAMSHDVSDGFRTVMKDLLEKLGYEDAAARL
jgi:hypothetical protein